MTTLAQPATTDRPGPPRRGECRTSVIRIRWPVRVTGLDAENRVVTSAPDQPRRCRAGRRRHRVVRYLGGRRPRAGSPALGRAPVARWAGGGVRVVHPGDARARAPARASGTPPGHAAGGADSEPG